MNIIIIFLLFLIISCSYPDIDTVPKFNLNVTVQEKCGFIYQINDKNKYECELFQIINRL